jgi:hypothetical protein
MLTAKTLAEIGLGAEVVSIQVDIEEDVRALLQLSS